MSGKIERLKKRERERGIHSVNRGIHLVTWIKKKLKIILER